MSSSSSAHIQDHGPSPSESPAAACIVESDVDPATAGHSGQSAVADIEEAAAESKKTIRILNWNVNGIKTVFGPLPKPSSSSKSSSQTASTDGSNFITAGGPDLIPIPSFLSSHSTTLLCLQETKLSDLKLTTSAGGTCPPDLIHVPGCDSFFALSEEKKGYSGTAIYVPEGATVSATTGKETLSDVEGRCVEVDLGEFVLINLYCPNGGRDLDYKFRFYERLVERVTRLVVEEKREVVMCGDFNIAHRACDIWNPDKNKDSIGFSPRERSLLDTLASAPLSLVDIYRHLHPSNNTAYTFWDMRTGKRATNQGWRIDYFWITPGLVPKVKRADILTGVQGSDHCPIVLELEGVELRSGLATCKEAANKRYPKPRSIMSFFAPKGKGKAEPKAVETKKAEKRDRSRVDDGDGDTKVDENAVAGPQPPASSVGDDKDGVVAKKARVSASKKE